MNKQEIQKEITNIANEEIPEQINLWPRIQSEILKSENKPVKHWHRFGKPALALFVFFLFTAASYFVYKNLNQDVSIPPQWVTEINQTQQENELSVTLEWAYLDASRASVGILTTFPAESETAYRINDVHLYSADGEEIPAMMRGGGGGGGGGGGDVDRQTGTHLNFDSSSLVATSQSVPLTLVLTYESLPGQEMDYQFSFDFSLPYFEAAEGKAKQSHMDQNGVWFEISQVSMTPSMTRFNLCYELPDENPNWVPLVFVDSGYMESVPMLEQQPDVLTDGKMGYWAHTESAPTVDGNTACVNMSAMAPYDGKADLTITVDSLTLDAISFTDDSIAAEKDYFAEQGFLLQAERYDFGQEMTGSMIVKVISEDQFIGIQVMDHPDTMNDTQAQTYIGSRVFKQRINGPWKFSIKPQ